MKWLDVFIFLYDQILSAKTKAAMLAKTYFHAIEVKITLTGCALAANCRENSYQKGMSRPRVGLNHHPFG